MKRRKPREEEAKMMLTADRRQRLPARRERSAGIGRSLALNLCLVGASWLAATSVASENENWNQFRGPRGDGHSTAESLPVRWGESENIVWKTPIRGKAWSSPVAWDDRIWLSSATEDGKELFAVEVEARTGRMLRELPVFTIEEPAFCYPFNSYASGTPVIEQGRLWVHYGSAGTACIDTRAGKVLWTRQDLPCDHHRGPGSSPIIFENLLIVHFDGFDQQYVVALDKNTGRTVWRKDRDIEYGSDNGDVKKSYATPTVIEHAGRRQLISPASAATIAYDPWTGEELWKVYHGGFNAAARPLFAHGLVYLNLEGGEKLLAVRPDGQGNVTRTHIAWSTKRGTPTRPSQLVVDDDFYMVSDAGILSCLDAKTGQEHWSKRIEGPHTASPLHAAGRIYLFDENGQSHVVAADRTEFRLLAANTLADGCMASPAVVDGALIVRTKSHLYRIQ